MEGVTIIKSATLPDYDHMLVSITTKESVAKLVVRIKGKSTLMFFDRHPKYRERYNRHFGERGYYFETVGGNPGIKEAVKTMELIMSNPTERDLIRARIDAEIDHRTLMLEAEARGEARGEEKGEARGRAIGKADAHKQDALRMKELGMSSDLISSITGLSPKDISEL